MEETQEKHPIDARGYLTDYGADELTPVVNRLGGKWFERPRHSACFFCRTRSRLYPFPRDSRRLRHGVVIDGDTMRTRSSQPVMLPLTDQSQ